VIRMLRVVVGPEGSIEEATGSLMQIAQEKTATPLSIPVSRHRDAVAARQDDPGDVDGIRGCMTAAGALLAAVEVAAGVAAEMLQADGLCAEVLFGGGKQYVPLPERQRHARRAAEREWCADAHAHAIDANGIPEAATVAGLPIRQRLDPPR